MATLAEICEAIRAKKIVIGFYNSYKREMCPHVAGYGKNHDEMALFYQFAGGSSSGLPADGSIGNWRCISLHALHVTEIKDGPWHTAPNYSIHQNCIKQVICEVSG